MRQILQWAKLYRDMYGWSVIPVGTDKRPTIKSWLEFQGRKATNEELEAWFKDGDNQLAIVTGSISNLSVVDIDSTDGEKLLDGIYPSMFSAPAVNTPRGGKHLYFSYHEGIRNKAGAIPGTDLRGEGGYVVAPPSHGVGGKQYTWAGPRPEPVSFPSLPAEYILRVEQTGAGRNAGPKDIPGQTPLTEGHRDNDLFHLAHSLVKGGMKPDEVAFYVAAAARACNPPFPEAEAMIKVQSAVGRAVRKERNLTEEIEHYVNLTEGYFSLNDIHNALQLLTKEDKALTSVVLHRLVGSRIVERMSNKNGVFRRIMRDLMPIRLGRPTESPLDLILPFGLHELVHTYPANVIVVAGAPDSGKTAFCLDLIEKNQDRFNINYFNSEMGETELNSRLILHRDMPIEAWKFSAFERSDHFDDVIGPDDINIVDYLEITTEFYKVAEEISNIHKKLAGHKGIAVVCIQKNRGVDLGRGGTFSMEKPRLYLAMDYGRVKIVKAKNWTDTQRNPNGLIKEFKLHGGASFEETTGWLNLDDLPQKNFGL